MSINYPQMNRFRLTAIVRTVFAIAIVMCFDSFVLWAACPCAHNCGTVSFWTWSGADSKCLGSVDAFNPSISVPQSFDPIWEPNAFQANRVNTGITISIMQFPDCLGVCKPQGCPVGDGTEVCSSVGGVGVVLVPAMGNKVCWPGGS